MLTFFQTKQVIIIMHLIESAVEIRAQIERLCEDICLWLESWKKLHKNIGAISNTRRSNWNPEKVFNY
jgi:hypothetical protein